MTDPELDAVLRAACAADGGCSFCAARVMEEFVKRCPGDNLFPRIEAAALRLGDNNEMDFADPSSVVAFLREHLQCG